MAWPYLQLLNTEDATQTVLTADEVTRFEIDYQVK